MNLAAQFKRLEEDGFPVLEVKGRIGSGDVALFEASLLDLGRHTTDGSVLDLVACPYLTSQAFPLILRASKDASTKARSLFVSVGREVQELLRVLRLDRQLALHPSRHEAILAARAFRGLTRKG
jgi:anti-anti-sigma regulatory factor